MTIPSQPGDAQLFDQLHTLFGIGDYNEDDGRPWFRFRMLEIGKLKAMRKKRGLTIADLMTAAEYCDRRDIKITAPWQLIGHLFEAKRERRQWEQKAFDREIDDAVVCERSLADHDQTWVDRLLLARGPYRKEVLEQWREHRNQNQKGKS